MKDIDFDELDRAVSSLMGDIDGTDQKKSDDIATQEEAAPAEVEGVATEEESVSDDDISTKSEVEPTVNTDDTVSDEEEEEPEAKPAKIVTRARGKFMDIVPNSSAAAKPSKAPADTTDVPKKPIIKPSAKFEESILTDQAAEDTVSVPSDDTEIKDQDTYDDVQSNEPSDKVDEIATPFLADAKVEKRPLGSATSTVTEDTPSDLDTTEDAVPAEDVKEDTTDQQRSVPTQMPAELSSDIVNVEAGGVITDAKTDEGEDLPEIETPSSIPQQYKTTETEVDQPKATMYDTHQEVVLSKKKHTGVWILLVIVLCILIGAGGGLLAYSMKLFG